MANYSDCAGLGIAGNFALHLEQAGELEDFKAIPTEDENGPKGIFPFYLKGFDGSIGIYPLSETTIRLPEEPCNVQAEPEVALLCELDYDARGDVSSIRPTHFGAYNDCSIRREGARKISEKKNWGADSKGIAASLLPIDTFEPGGMMDRWRIASFLRRGESVYRYGEDVELTGYSYFHGRLLAWLVRQINTQTEVGPLEPVGRYLNECGRPARALISIGATRYTPFGERTFLQSGDEVVVALYDGETHSGGELFERVVSDALEAPGISALVQRVV